VRSKRQKVLWHPGQERPTFSEIFTSVCGTASHEFWHFVNPVSCQCSLLLFFLSFFFFLMKHVVSSLDFVILLCFWGIFWWIFINKAVCKRS
jgi:hypothetical protein